MKNYIGFRTDQTLCRKNGGVITYIKATAAVDAEQLIAKPNTYVEYQLKHMKIRFKQMPFCNLHKNNDNNNI